MSDDERRRMEREAVAYWLIVQGLMALFDAKGYLDNGEWHELEVNRDELDKRNNILGLPKVD